MSLDQEISALLNKHSAENASGTPDFVLADFLIASLEAFNAATRLRDAWYGREKAIAAASVETPTDNEVT